MLMAIPLNLNGTKWKWFKIHEFKEEFYAFYMI